MEPNRTIFAEWRDAGTVLNGQFQTGVSLHSHTLHSREILDFIPRLSRQIPILGSLVQYELDRYRRIHGADLDWDNAWWTPPLSPRQAWEVESTQIHKRGLRPLVSITDHDSIDAPLALRATSFASETPVSFEWTFPFRETFFHFGIHNLPQSWFARMQAFTTQPTESEGLAILRELHDQEPECLIVLNHPLWDEKGIGTALHRSLVCTLLASEARTAIHALELNGLRSVAENNGVIALAEDAGLPLISGGDRHTFEPNACINLSNAASFSLFVEEVRGKKCSHILWMQHYRNPLVTRIARNVAEVLRSNPGHCLGWTRWSDRVFYTPAGSSDAVPVGSAWQREPWIVSAFVASMGLLE